MASPCLRPAGDFVSSGAFFKAVEDAFVPVIKFKFDGIEVSGLHEQAHTFCSVRVFSVRQ